jgi:hypothetical protein
VPVDPLVPADPAGTLWTSGAIRRNFHVSGRSGTGVCGHRALTRGCVTAPPMALRPAPPRLRRGARCPPVPERSLRPGPAW